MDNEQLIVEIKRYKEELKNHAMALEEQHDSKGVKQILFHRDSYIFEKLDDLQKELYGKLSDLGDIARLLKETKTLAETNLSIAKTEE